MKIRSKASSFEFEPYRFGPYSHKLISDIEFLVNLGYLEKSDEDIVFNQDLSLENIENLKAENFLSNKTKNEFVACEEDEEYSENKESVNTISDDSVVYRMTEKGTNYLRKSKILELDEAKQISKIRQKYGKKSLMELLRHVYLAYPKFATESEIKEKMKKRSG